MEIRIIRPYSPDVVYAPPAFKGQQSAKGATKARFAMWDERIKKANTVQDKPVDINPRPKV